jgi:murein DD-endopeptidase MepM/ murein hydrolase activator NlpD
LYAPPFQSGKKFLIVQGFGGKQTHHTQPSLYAVDIAMPEGEAVCAAREGVVADLYDGEDAKASHFVRIQQQDGTLGDYEHLRKGSIRLTVGQRVAKGECFAVVGTTGNTTGPHLHFSILRKKSSQSGQILESQPFQFKGTSSGIVPGYLMWLENSIVK